MAKRRRSRSTRMHRRRRSRVDIVPFNFCGTGLSVPPPPPDTEWSCATPLNQQFLVADGGALDELLLKTADVTPADRTPYFDAQGVNRGLSFLGAEFWLRASVTDQLTNAGMNGPAIFTFRLACALVRQEWEWSDGVKSLSPAPNLFQRDERELSDVLYRWPLYLGPILLPLNADPNFVAAIQHADTQGGAAFFEQGTNDTYAGFYQKGVGSGASNQMHHRVRSRRFLDEKHYLALCFSLAVPIAQDDVFAIGFEANGYLKIRGK